MGSGGNCRKWNLVGRSGSLGECHRYRSGACQVHQVLSSCSTGPEPQPQNQFYVYSPLQLKLSPSVCLFALTVGNRLSSTSILMGQLFDPFPTQCFFALGERNKTSLLPVVNLDICFKWED